MVSVVQVELTNSVTRLNKKCEEDFDLCCLW